MVVNIDQKNELPIPYKNHYLLASHLYHRLTNSDLSDGSTLHDRNEWSPYTVSKVLPTDPERRFESDGIYSPTWTFILRSINEEIIQKLRGSFALKPQIKVGKTIGEVKSIKKGKNPDFTTTVEFSTLSPIMIKAPEIAENGKKIVSPEHNKFEDVICKKLQNSYELANDQLVEGKMDIWIDDHSKTQVRVSHNEEDLLPAWELKGHMRGNEEVLRHAYLGGIGAKTALGLGCWEVDD